MSFVTPVTDWVAADPVLYTDMNRIEGNTEALWNPPSASSGFLDVANYSINSTTYADVDATNLSLSITITGDTILILLNFVVLGTRAVYFDIYIDSARIGGDDGIMQSLGATSGRVPVCMAIRKTGLSAGVHTVKLQWKNDGGGSSVLYGGNGSAGDQTHPIMDVVEIS